MDQTYYQSHGDFYPCVGESYGEYGYGDSSDSTTNYRYGYDFCCSELSYYNLYGSMSAYHYPFISIKNNRF